MASASWERQELPVHRKSTWRRTGSLVLTGKLTAVPQARDILAGFAVISPLRFRFRFPPHAEHATAVGAALSA
jgi:hypothetical protein